MKKVFIIVCYDSFDVATVAPLVFGSYSTALNYAGLLDTKRFVILSRIFFD